MRIIYLHQYFNTPEMSGGTRSWEMGRRLVNDGHQVHMVTMNRDPRTGISNWYTTEEAGIIVHWLPLSYSNYMSFRKRIYVFLLFSLRARSKIMELEGDIIFASSTPLTIAIPAVLASKAKKIPMVFEVRDLWPETPIAMGALRNPLLRLLAHQLELFAYRNSSRIVVLSENMREGVARSGYKMDQIAVIPNSCDIELFKGHEDGGKRIRSINNWLNQRPLIIYTGAFGKVNGVDYMVRLAAATKLLDPEIRFAVIGSGSEERKIRTLAESLGVLGSNFYMIDRIPKNEIPEWLAASDIAASWCVNIEELWANSANKFFDALAAGKPIAINYMGWQKELIESEDCGIVLPPEDLNVAAQTLVKKIRDSKWIKSAGDIALNVAKTQFDRDELYIQLERVITEAANTT